MNVVAVPEQTLIRVAANSRASAVGGAIAGMVRDDKTVAVQAIGAASVNQAVKAIALARQYLVEDGIDILCAPSFSETMIDGQERTVLRLDVIALPR